MGREGLTPIVEIVGFLAGNERFNSTRSFDDKSPALITSYTIPWGAKKHEYVINQVSRNILHAASHPS